MENKSRYSDSETLRLHNAVLEHIIKAKRRTFEAFELFGRRWYYRAESKTASRVSVKGRKHIEKRTCVLYMYGKPFEDSTYQMFHSVGRIELKSNEFLPGTEPKKKAKGSRNQSRSFYRD